LRDADVVGQHVRRTALAATMRMTDVSDDPLGDRFGLISRFGLDPAKGRNRRVLNDDTPKQFPNTKLRLRSIATWLAR